MEENFLKIAKQAATEAGKLISAYAGKVHTINVKNEDASDFATEADLEAQKLIVSILSKSFPNHNIIAEEDERTDKGSDYTWVIDPLDGTISFAAGMPHYGVSIGLLENNKPILGVVYHIKFKDLYWATKGGGAYLNGKPIQVSNQHNLDQAGMVLDTSHRAKRQAKIDLYVTPLLTKVGYSYSLGSAVVALGLIADGSLDGTVNQGWVWDFTAGSVIVKEAGGLMTDLSGKEPDWSKDRLSIVASNGLIHDKILEALK